MKRLILIALSLFFVLAPAASAHPLGNFTVNRFARLEAAGDRVYVRYVLDLAEIPTFQDRGTPTGAYVQRIRRGLRLSVDGTPASFVPVARSRWSTLAAMCGEISDSPTDAARIPAIRSWMEESFIR